MPGGPQHAFRRADLHGTIFVSCDKLTTGLRHDLRLVCTSKKCRSILKHVLKRYSNRKLSVSVSHATKIVTCKSALRRPISIAVCRTEIFILLKLPYFCEKKKKKRKFTNSITRTSHAPVQDCSQLLFWRWLLEEWLVKAFVFEVSKPARFYGIYSATRFPVAT